MAEERQYFVEGIGIDEQLDAQEYFVEGVGVNESVESDGGGAGTDFPFNLYYGGVM